VSERPGATSPRFTARMAGLCHLLMMLAEAMAAFARRGLIVAGDAAAIASNQYCAIPLPRLEARFTTLRRPGDDLRAAA
jgi:hypothetical protein